MSVNSNFENELSQFDQLSESVSRGLYQDRFDAHLQRLMTIDFTVHRLPNELPLDNLNLRRYLGWEQTAFEMSNQYERMEPEKSY